MEKFSWKKRGLSFKYALTGLKSFITKEHNAWIHTGATAFVLILGFTFHLSFYEWIAIVFCIGLVFAAEAFNTAIERLVNLVSPEFNRAAGDVKDIAAGAVLICAVTAAIIGLLIFLPKVIS